MVYDVRLPTASETPDIIQFIASTWGRHHILANDADLLQWQLSWDLSPKMRGSGISALTVWDRNELVGMQGLIHAPFRIGAERLTSVWLCNLMVAEHHRARGVGARLMTSVHNLPVDVVATSGINPDILPLYRKMRYHVINALDRYIYVNNIDKFYELTGYRIYQDVEGPQKERPSNSILMQHDEDFDEFWTSFKSHSLGSKYVGIDRTKEYMRWRYVQHPRFRYRIVTGRDASGTIYGLIVYRIERISGFDGSVVRILEIDAIDEHSFSLMMGAAGDIACQNAAIFCDYYSSIDLPITDIATIGWMRSSEIPEAVPSYFQPLDYRHQNVSVAARALRTGFSPSDWSGRLSITKSDGDQDRPNLITG